MRPLLEHFIPSTSLCFAVIVMVAATQGCAPRRPYRAPMPPAPAPTVPPTPAAPPVTRFPLPPEGEKSPLPQEAKIREQDIQARRKATPLPSAPSVSEPMRLETGVPELATRAPAVPDDSSLLAKITPSTPPQRAVSLRLAEEGKGLLETRDFPRALNRLERSIAIDSGNAYGYFYIAKAHYLMGRHKESLNFLDVAESRLSGEPFWLAEVHALRGENFRALGMFDRAEESYAKALTINSGNRTATEALSRRKGESQPAQR